VAHGDYPTVPERGDTLGTDEHIIDLIDVDDEAGVAAAMAEHLAGRSVIDNGQRVDPQAIRQSR
jgi:hypothetical protein